MFIALGLLFLSMLAGFALRRWLDAARLSRMVTPVVMLLLFSLGVAVGGNNTLMADLPRLGNAALILALSGLAGSLLAVRLLCRNLRPAKAGALSNTADAVTNTCATVDVSTQNPIFPTGPLPHKGDSRLDKSDPTFHKSEPTFHKDERA